MSRGSVYQALQKLSGDWSAPEYAKTLTREVLTELLPSFEMMEPLVRARLLLAAASLPASAQDVMREQLQALCSKALSDKEEWVSMMGRALGPFDGRAHADAVAKGSAAVRDALKTLEGLTAAARTDGMRPLEEVYLSPRVRDGAAGAPAERSGHTHFRLREGALARLTAASQAAANLEAAPSALQQPAMGPATASPAAQAHASGHAAKPAAPALSAPRPASQAPSRSAAAKSAGIDDMFRSSRPANLSRPGAAAAGKPGHRTVKLLDVSEAIQQRHRPGAQHRRFPAASSLLHVSSPGHSRPPQSPAPHQAAGHNSSAPLQVPRAKAPHHAGPAKQAPAGPGMSRLKGSGHDVGAHSQAPCSPAPHLTAGESSSPAQAATALSPQHASRSPGAASQMPTGPGLSHLQGPGHAAPPASANGSAARAIMGREPPEDKPDSDVEEGEMPEDGELPEEALQQSKRGRFEHNHHHKPFREGSPHEQLTSSATTLPFPAQ